MATKTFGQYKGVDIIAGDDKSVQSQIAKIDSSTPTVPIASTTSSITAKPIPATSLKQNTSTYNPPEPPSNYSTTVAVNSVADRPPSTPVVPEPQLSQKDQLSQKFLSEVLGRDLSTEKAQLRNNADLLSKQEEANRLQNELKSRKQAYEDEIDELRKNTGGVSFAGNEARVDELRRKANKDLANIAIQAEFANNNYLGAEKILNSQLEDLQQDYENTVKTYQIAEDFLANDLTESEKIELTALKDKEAADYQLERSKALASYNQQLEQSSPLYKAQVANLYSQIDERTNTVNENGTLNGKPQNVSQTAANGYADRLNQSNVILGNLGNKFTGKTAIGGKLPNIFQSGDRQAYEQAKKNFATAVLRRESGAAIAPSEFKTLDETYFPQAGDGAQVLANKEKLRNTVINSFYREANVARPVLPGMIVESNGRRYKVGADGESLEEI